MKKFESFSTRHPIVFGFVLILLFTLLSTIAWPITQIYPYPEKYELSGALAKLMIASCFMLLLWGFGWLKIAGYPTLGSQRTWLVTIALMIYNAIFAIYAFTGSFQFGLPSISLTLAVIFFTFTTSLLEETMYRGLLLTAMVNAWGDTRPGLFAAAILSGLFWASLHFFNLIIRPFPVVALQVLGMAIVGFVYASIVLFGRSIWPPIVFHWVINTVVSLQVSQNQTLEETTQTWLIFNLIVLPMVAVGVYLMQKATLNIKSVEQGMQRNMNTTYKAVLEKYHGK